MWHALKCVGYAAPAFVSFRDAKLYPDLEGRSPTRYSRHSRYARNTDVVAHYRFVPFDKTTFEVIMLCAHLFKPFSLTALASYMARAFPALAPPRPPVPQDRSLTKACR